MDKAESSQQDGLWGKTSWGPIIQRQRDNDRDRVRDRQTQPDNRRRPVRLTQSDRRRGQSDSDGTWPETTDERREFNVPTTGTGSTLGERDAAVMDTVDIDIGLRVERAVAAAVGVWAAEWRLAIEVEDEERGRREVT